MIMYSGKLRWPLLIWLVNVKRVAEFCYLGNTVSSLGADPSLVRSDNVFCYFSIINFTTNRITNRDKYSWIMLENSSSTLNIEINSGRQILFKSLFAIFLCSVLHCWIVWFFFLPTFIYNLIICFNSSALAWMPFLGW